MQRAELVEGLRSLGISRGDVLLVHSSLASLGHVEGGADTVINALMEVIGEEGLLVMPTFASPDKIFDRRRSPTGLGAIPDAFWRRPQVLRSMHPTHSVAAWGKGAQELICGHEKASDAYGESTPYEKIALWGGKILLLGVDLDRCTMLHTIEALSDAPYLDTVEASYLDDHGVVHTIEVKRMAGPHRHFLGLNKRLIEDGIMVKGKVGDALCSLIKAKEMIDLGLSLIKGQPDLMLCHNPSCLDCQLQRGAIKKRTLSDLPIPPVGVNSLEISYDIEDVLRVCAFEGISSLELAGLDDRYILELKPKELDGLKGYLNSSGFQVFSLDLGRHFIEDSEDPFFYSQRAVKVAQRLGAERIVFSISPSAEVMFLELSGFFSYLAELGEKESCIFLMENMATPRGDLRLLLDALKKIDSPYLRLAYNPANYGLMGGRPFLDPFPFKILGQVKDLMGLVYVNDAVYGGTYTRLSKGNSEIKELLSLLICRGFKGPLIFKTEKVPDPGRFTEEASWFWEFVREVL
jgi:aminoglycoside 3-N-acetyltransferase